MTRELLLNKSVWVVRTDSHLFVRDIITLTINFLKKMGRYSDKVKQIVQPV